MRLIISKNWVNYIAAFALSSALLVNAPAHAKKSYAAHTQEITRLAQAHEAGQISIKAGDAFTVIAQRYAQANNLPLDVAIKGLIASNPDAFEDEKLNLKFGVTLVIPLKDDVLKTVNASLSASTDAATAPAESTVPAAVEPAVQSEVKPEVPVEVPSAVPASEAAPAPSGSSAC